MKLLIEVQGDYKDTVLGDILKRMDSGGQVQLINDHKNCILDVTVVEVQS